MKHDKEAEKEKKKEEKKEGKKASGGLSMSGGAQMGTPETKKGKISGFMNLFKGKKEDTAVSPGRESPTAVDVDYEPSRFGFHLPSFGKSLSLSLFGKNPKLRPVRRGDTSSFSLPNVHVTLNPDASTEFRHASWRVVVSASELGLGSEVDLFTGSGQLVSLKSGDVEAGVSVTKDSMKHFFVLPPRRTFSLRFRV